jgi:hypothetical protein
VAERALQDGRERRLGQGSDADRGHRDPNLHGGYVLVDVAELLQCERGSFGAVLAHDFQPCAARSHERVLRDHEERVARDEQRRDDEL